MKKTYKIKALPASNNFIETILTQEEIDNYKKGGYFVEELETYQDEGEVISQYGWDYKKEGDKYLTKRSNSNKWIEATGEPLKAIKQKIYKEVPYTKQDQKSDYISNVQTLIDKGYTLDDLVKQRVGTKEGLLNLFPSLETKKEVKKETKKETKKEVEKEESETQEYIPTLSEIYNIEQSVIGKPKKEYPISAKDLIEATKEFNKNKKEKVKDIKKEYPISPQDIFKATREFNENKVIVDDTEEISERPTFLPTIPTWQDAFNQFDYSELEDRNIVRRPTTMPNMTTWQDVFKESDYSELEDKRKSERPTTIPTLKTWQDVFEESDYSKIDTKKEYPISPEDLIEATREFNKRKLEKPTTIPELKTWQDVFKDPAYYSQVPEEEYIETEATDKEIKELEKQGYKVEVVPTFDFNTELMQRIKNAEEYESGITSDKEQVLDALGRPLSYMNPKTGLYEPYDPKTKFSELFDQRWWKQRKEDILTMLPSTWTNPNFKDFEDLVTTYYQRKTDKNNTVDEPKTKSISELKKESPNMTPEITDENLESTTVYKPLVVGEDIQIKNNKYNPTGRRVYRQEYIELDNIKLGFRNRNELQEIETKGGSVTSFYPFNTKKSIAMKNEYPSNATFIGIDTDGSFKTGKLEDFENTDKIARVFTNLVDEFILEKDGSVKLESRNKNNPTSPVPVVMVIEKDEYGNEIKKEGSINVLTKKVKDARNQFGPIQGGRVILKGSDGKSILVSGSLNNIYEQFKEIRERTGKPVEIIQLDNGSYNLGLSTKDGKLTTADLKAYDKLHTTGGNFLYIIEEKENSFENKVNKTKSKLTEEEKEAFAAVVNNTRNIISEYSKEIPILKDIFGDINITRNIPDYSRFVKSPTAKNFREDIIEPGYKYGMSTDDLLREKGYLGKGIGSDPFIDCSGAVCKVMTSLGENLGNPLSTNAQKIHDKTREIKNEKNWKDGDIITFKTEGDKVDHIGFLIIDEDTGEKYIAESSRSFQEGRIVPFEQRLEFLYNVYPDMKYYIKRFEKS